MEYNALIREYSGGSFNILARILVAELKDFPADWKIRYKTKEVDRETTDIRDLCCCPKNPLQIYKPTPNGFPVTVRTIDGKSMEVIVSAQDTVKILKLKISQVDEQYPVNIQELHVSRNNSDLRLTFDWATMGLLNIAESSTIYLKPKSFNDLYFGVNFKAINVEQTYERSNGHFAPPSWSQYASGINFSGACPNPCCLSKRVGVQREVVARPQPYGEVRINLTRGENPLECSACSTSDAVKSVTSQAEGDISFQIMPSCYLLCNARSLVFCKRNGDEQVFGKCFQSKNKDKESAYRRFEVEGKIDIFESTTVEPWRSPFCCVKCDTSIKFKAHEFHMLCGHVYHRWCMPSILKGMKCKVCHTKILIVGKMDDVLKVV